VDAVMEIIDKIPEQVLVDALNSYHTLIFMNVDSSKESEKGVLCNAGYINEGVYQILINNCLYNDEPQRKLADFLKAKYSWIEIEDYYLVDFSKNVLELKLKFNVEISDGDLINHEMMSLVKHNKNMYPILTTINDDLKSIGCIIDEWDIEYFDRFEKILDKGTMYIYIPIDETSSESK
jgi:hypothetical protein